MLTPEQREARRSTIGASDIPKLAGLSRFGKALSVYREKVDGLDFGIDPFTGEPREGAEIGHETEKANARIYMRKRGVKVKSLPTLTHPRFAWATATPDRRVKGQAILVELKNVGAFMVADWDLEAEDGVPEDYRAQVTWQLGIAREALREDFRTADVSAFLGGTRHRIFSVEWDPPFFDDLLAIGWAFVSNHLRPKVPPPLDGTEESAAFLRARYPEDNGLKIDAPIETIAWAHELQDTIEIAKLHAVRIEELKTLLKSVMGDAAEMRGEWGRATWKKNAGGAVSWKAVVEDLRSTLALTIAELARKGTSDDDIRKAVAFEVERAADSHKAEGARPFLFQYGHEEKPSKGRKKDKQL